MSTPHCLETGFVALVRRAGRWRAERVSDFRIVRQLRREAGLADDGRPDPADAYDRLLACASEHGLGLETSGEDE